MAATVDERDDAELVALALAGDRGAFAALFERHRPLLVGLCRRSLADPALVEDALQEAALQALLNLSALRRPERFGPWLGGIGLNVCRTMLRRAGRADWSWEAIGGGHARREPPDADPLPHEAVEGRERRAAVRRAVAELPRGQRAAVLCFYLRGLTYAETAAQLGVAPGAVRTRLHKARRSLRIRLQELWQEETMASGGASDTLVPVEVADVRGRAGEAGWRSPRIVFLRERGGERQLPIWVGPHEGAAIALILEGVSPPRPLTFPFLANVLAAAGGRLRETRIVRLTEDTYYAVARIEGANRIVELDARPSDAIALALTVGAPIAVNAQVFAAQEAYRQDPACAERTARMGEFSEGAAAIAAATRGLWTPRSPEQGSENPAE